MPFSVAHLNVDARELTVKMMNRALDMLCAEFARTGGDEAELALPKTELRQRNALQDGVKSVLKKRSIDPDTAISAMKVLRFAQFKTPEVLPLSIPNQSREGLPDFTGLIAPVAATVMPVVVADIAPYETGEAGGFEVFVQPEFVRNLDNVRRFVSALEDVLVECNYRVPEPEGNLESPRAVGESRANLSLKMCAERVRALEAELRAKGLLL
jgi:hypothetical protein